MPPKVTVVIPLYNKEAYIGRALDSVLAQTERDFEVVVVDDSSTDGSAGVVRSYSDPRIRYLLQPNAFASAARNRGVREARADLVAFLDADDQYRPRFLETVLRMREKFPQAGAYACAYTLVDPGGRERRMSFRALPPFPWEGLLPDYFESALGPQPVWTSAVAIPRAVFDRVGYFLEERRPGEDIELWFRIALAYPIAFSSVEGAVYRRDVPGTISDTMPALDGFVLVSTARAALAAGRVPAGRERAVEGLIDKQLLATGAQLVLAGRPAEARRVLSSCRSGHFRGQVAYWYAWACVPSPVTRWAVRLKRMLRGRRAS